MFDDTITSRGHGSPYDRGGADSYYRRPFDPHWWPEGTRKGTRVELKDMSVEEILEYTRGYKDNEEAQDFKDWG